MRAEHVHKFYPFSFRVSPDLRMSEVPKRLREILPTAAEGALLTDIFEFRRPRTAPTWSALSAFQSSSFEIAGIGQGRAVSALLHDLFSPIALIMAATQLAQDSMNIARSAADEAPVDWKKLHTYQKEVSEFLSHILESTYRARDLIRTFKDISIDQTSSREREVVLVEYIRNLMLTFKPLFHQHTVQVSVTGDETVTNRRPGLIAQMLTNLVENTVRHGFEHQKEGTIRIDISRVDDDILIDYSDDGAGMDAETLAKHLEPFYTSKAEHGGSGLGTYTIQTIIEESFGGSMTVHSAPGKGTRYLLRYPA